MRRRQVWALEAALLDPSTAPPAVQVEIAPEFVQVSSEAHLSVQPGDCPKCLRHIGRGLAMHRKHCKGVTDG